MKYLLVTLMLLGQLASSKESLYDAIDAKTLITIKSYDPITETYKVSIEHEATGPNYTNLKFLIQSVDTLSGHPPKNPNSIVGNNYKLDRDLVLFSEDGFDRLRKKDLK